jgi:hypothetical protein
MAPTLESILQDYFGCKKPFLKRPRVDHYEDKAARMTYLSVSGAKAYGKLIDLVYDIERLCEVKRSIDDTLDAIASEDDFWKER